MKKIISVILITFTLLSVLPAADGTTEHSVIPAAGDTFGYLIKPYQPLTARALGMGSAGVALPGRSDTFYINPAALASNFLYQPSSACFQQTPDFRSIPSGDDVPPL